MLSTIANGLSKYWIFWQWHFLFITHMTNMLLADMSASDFSLMLPVCHRNNSVEFVCVCKYQNCPPWNAKITKNNHSLPSPDSQFFLQKWGTSVGTPNLIRGSFCCVNDNAHDISPMHRWTLGWWLLASSLGNSVMLAPSNEEYLSLGNPQIDTSAKKIMIFVADCCACCFCESNGLLLQW